ncbi:MAG: YkgJ family cysteine cluster protein [Planctomycetota bacterium]
MSQTPWYREGLRFQCTGCGHCCTGEPGHVYVVKAEIEGLAAALGVDVTQFEQQFVRRVGRRKSLVELLNGDCVLFDRATRRCRVYEQRPRQCRTWPFWRSNVETPAAWDETCRTCPGSGRGPLVPSGQVDAQLAIIRV